MALSVTSLSLFLVFLVLSQLCSVLPLVVVKQQQRCGVATALTPPSCVPVQEIGIKARHELIGPAGQTAHYNAQQGPTAGVKRAQYLLIIYSFSLSVSLGPSLPDSLAFAFTLSPLLVFFSPISSSLYSSVLFFPSSHLFFSPFFFLSPLLFVCSSFIHSLSQVSSTSGSVYLFLDLSYSICLSLIQTQT